MAQLTPFEQAFAKARQDQTRKDPNNPGAGQFVWEGRSYTTARKDDTKGSPTSAPAADQVNKLSEGTAGASSSPINNNTKPTNTPKPYSKTSNYNVGNLKYPLTLGTNEDMQHYVSFYINVRGKSNFEKDNRFSGSVANNNSSRITSAQAGTAITRLGALTGGLTALAAATQIAKGAKTGGAKGAGKALASKEGLAILGGAASAIALSTIGSGSLSGSLKPDNKQRLKDVISLYLQESPSVKYGVNYQNVDLGVLGGLLSKAGGSVETLRNQAGELLELGLFQLAKIPSVIPGVGGTVGNLLEISSKAKTNPFREVLFDSVDYRTFNFRYRFLPRDPKESIAVKKIIDKFKLHMLPELSKDEFFYIYPSEFEIQYFFKSKQNLYFNKIASCALTDLQVDFGGDRFSTFDNGAPTEVNLTLTFRELELMNKQTAYNGY
jgi:hypothetical protein